MSRLAQLVERKTLNLVVVGSSPTVGVLFAFFWPQLLLFFFSENAQLADQVTHRSAPVAQLAARGSHNPKVASSILVSRNSNIRLYEQPSLDMCVTVLARLART